MKSLANIFAKGLLFTLPLAITFGLLYWLLATAEGLFKIPLQWLLPPGWYITGMGVVSAVLVIFGIGVLARAYLIELLFQWVDDLIDRIPVVKTLYSSAKDLLQFFAGNQEDSLSRVVKVTFDDSIHLIGFVTNESVELAGESELYAVFFPMSYQMGGYMAYIPKGRCELLDIPVQTAMQQVLTAHIQQKRKRQQ